MKVSKYIWEILIVLAVLCMVLIFIFGKNTTDTTAVISDSDKIEDQTSLTTTTDAIHSSASSSVPDLETQETESAVVPMVVPVTPNQEKEEIVPPSPVPTPSMSGVTSVHIQSILAGHNTTRAGKGLSPLTYAPSVAKSAQAWADNLAGRGCILEHSDGPYGENLYFSWTTAKTQTLDPTQAVFWWLDEEQYYNYSKNTCQAGEQCGHYTQAVWKETTQVGCGVSVCDDGDRLTQMWVCQYNPSGNNGDRPY